MNGADALHYVQRLGLTAIPSDVTDVQDRQDDFYISLVGELFDRLRNPYNDPIDWSRLGNAITQVGIDGTDDSAPAAGVLPADASLFASAAFYLGGYPASANLTLRPPTRHS